MNLPKHILGLAVIIVSLTSCKDNAAEPEATQTETTTATTDVENTTTATPDTPVNNAAPAATAPMSAAAENTATPAVNPPHGQPGHRCEIPVGAPLNSQPANTNAPVMQQQAPSANPASFMQPAARQQTATPTAPGMNPPHGQPGHRCDVAVGAPLP